MLDQPVDKKTYFKINNYRFLIWFTFLLALAAGISEGATSLNPGRGLAIFLGVCIIPIVIQIAGSIKYKNYLKTWKGHPRR